MKNIIIFIFLSFQISCQLSGGLSSSPSVGSVKVRESLALELLNQPDQWSTQCQTSKNDLLCWLSDKKNVKTVTEENRLPIQQGVTSDHVVQLAITIAKTESDLVIRLFDRNHKLLIAPIRQREAIRDFSDLKNILVSFDGLTPGQTYELIVAAKDGELLDEREVSTLPAAIKKLKFAVVSCANDEFYPKGGAELWSGLWTAQPQFILEIGDNVYADVKDGKALNPITERNIWDRYIETRSLLNIYKKHKLIPIVAIWDDHDYGYNDGDRTFALKDKSLQIFKDFFAQDDISQIFQNGPSNSSMYTVGGQRFLFMDDRYYRSVNKPSSAFIKNKGYAAYPVKSDNETYETHFGKEGEAFIDKYINEDQKPTWLISGDQFFGNYHNFESYEGNHPNSFRKFISQLKLAKAKIVFVSGDRHVSEIMKISKSDLGYKSYEITSSPIHSRSDPKSWDVDKNPRQIAGAAGVYNYTIVESEVSKNKLKFKVSTYKNSNATKENLLYDKALEVGE